jgi:hypothetical protein
MKLRECVGGVATWCVTADCAGLLLLLKDDELFFAALCTWCAELSFLCWNPTAALGNH